MIADGGEAICDLAVLRDQPEVFGQTATAWRVLDSIDTDALSRLRAARAVARERAWLLRAENGRGIRSSSAGGRATPGLVLDVDATLVRCHSEEEQAAPNFKGGFGYHPLLVFLDNTNEALAGILRPGNGGANTAADHLAVTDLAVSQIPEAHRYGTPILIRADGAGCSKAWLAHLRSLRYRLLHVAARITRGQRRTWLRIAEHWPWRQHVAAAFAALAKLPQPLRI